MTAYLSQENGTESGCKTFAKYKSDVVIGAWK